MNEYINVERLKAVMFDMVLDAEQDEIATLLNVYEELINEIEAKAGK